MFKKNNSQEPVVNEYVPLRTDVKIFALVVLVLVVVVLYFVITFNTNKEYSLFRNVPVPESEQALPSVASDDFVRTNLSQTVPKALTAFMSSTTPLNIEESYILKYPQGEQSTIIYQKIGSVTENTNEIAKWLGQNDWVVMSSSTLPTVASLYAMKRGADMNITIAADVDETKSKITVSIFNRE